MSALEEHIVDAAVWRGSDFKSKADVTVTLEVPHLADIDTCLRNAQQQGLTLETLEQKDFELPATAGLLQDVKRELQVGRGIVILKGIDVARYSTDELGMIYWGIGTHLGTGLSQSVMGDRLGHVMDVSAVDPHARAYRNKQELTPHTDLSDIVGLMCLQTAKSGGISIATSSLAVHNELVARFPLFLEVLHRGFFYHRRGEQAPGEEPVTPFRVPVFSWWQGQLSCRYVRSYIETAAKEEGRAALTQLESDALNCLERLTYELAFEFTMDAGEIYLINNYTVLHARTAFENWPEPERRRHLLRLWLRVPGWRPMDPEFIRHGQAGVEAQPGKKPSYEGSIGSGRIATKQP